MKTQETLEQMASLKLQLKASSLGASLLGEAGSAGAWAQSKGSGALAGTARQQLHECNIVPRLSRKCTVSQTLTSSSTSSMKVVEEVP